MATELETKAVEILDKVTSALADAAQPAAEAVLMAVFFEGLANVLAAVFWLALVLGFAHFARAMSRRAHQELTAYNAWVNNPQKGMRDKPASEGFLATLLAIGLWGGALFSTIGIGVNALSAYTWAALFNPPAALALKILNGIGG